ncbi:glyoxylate/hydroxypyruvate reductase A [Pseudotabrizicola sp. 4114]|uniref:2-hydroxyacid dehydrogenase n=1 Tax=Pseudotabrizicola sp. 4114 TaxID=2817731 RepID=UPI0028567E91|nr:glyoxylate/hydroxypyruvate reductase A [Pseudorhodobacter sp. 4114]
MALLFLSTPARAPVWRQILSDAGETMIDGEGAVTDPALVTEIACWTPPEDLGRYPNLRVVISVGAGVDHLPPMPPGVALSRTLAPGIEAMVRDWVVMATLMLHRDMPVYLDQARSRLWRTHPVRAASARRVGILGMGRIGGLVAGSLTALGFDVAGLSRSGAGADMDSVPVFGMDQRDAFLARSDLLVCLLPLTGETEGILDASLFAALPKGAGLIHAGRGKHLNMPDLQAALTSGQLSAAVLDVTEPEPLPPGHWLWHDPRVIITPHIAAQTDAAEGARHALAVIRAMRQGLPVPGLVNQDKGY